MTILYVAMFSIWFWGCTHAIPTPSAAINNITALINGYDLSAYRSSLLNRELLQFLNQCDQAINPPTQTLCYTYYDMLVNISKMNQLAGQFKTTESIKKVLNLYQNPEEIKDICISIHSTIPKQPMFINVTTNFYKKLSKITNCQWLCQSIDVELYVLPICKIISIGFQMISQANTLKPKMIPIDTKPTVPEIPSIDNKNILPISTNTTKTATTTTTTTKTTTTIASIKLTKQPVTNYQTIGKIPKTKLPEMFKELPHTALVEMEKLPPKTIFEATTSNVNSIQPKQINDNHQLNVKNPKEEEKRGNTGDNVVNVVNAKTNLETHEQKQDDNYDTTSENENDINPAMNNGNNQNDEQTHYVNQEEKKIIDDNNDEFINPQQQKSEQAHQHQLEEIEKINDDINDMQSQQQQPQDQENLENRFKSSSYPSRSIPGPFDDGSDSNFFMYFMSLMLICIVLYVAYHNKTKVIALVLEGRRTSNGRGGGSIVRRKHTAAYRKLNANLEEAITSNASDRTAQIIY